MHRKAIFWFLCEEFRQQEETWFVPPDFNIELFADIEILIMEKTIERKVIRITKERALARTYTDEMFLRRYTRKYK